MCGFLPGLNRIMTCAAFQWMRKYLVLNVALKIIVSILTTFGGSSLIILPFKSKPDILLVLIISRDKSFDFLYGS